MAVIRRKARRRSSRPTLPPGLQLPGCALVIDIGSNLAGWAWARLDAEGQVLERSSGVLDLAPGEAPSARWQRVDRFAKWLTWATSELGVTWLAAEEPHTQKDNVGTRHLLHGLFTMCDVFSGRKFGQGVTPISRIDVFKATLGWCLRALTPEEVVVWEKRKRRKAYRTPMRGPTKSEMRAAINARHAKEFGREITSEDEADAIAALDMVLAEIAGTGPNVVQIAPQPPKQPRIPSVAKLPLFAARRRAAGRKSA